MTNRSPVPRAARRPALAQRASLRRIATPPAAQASTPAETRPAEDEDRSRAVARDRFECQRAAMRATFVSFAVTSGIGAISPLLVAPAMLRHGIRDLRGPVPYDPDRNAWRGAWTLTAAVPAGLVSQVLYVVTVPLGVTGVLLGTLGSLATAAFRSPPRPHTPAAHCFAWLRARAAPIACIGADYYLRDDNDEPRALA